MSVGALVQKPLTSLMSVGKDAIRAPEQLRGKRVGTAGIPYQSAYLETILRTAGVDPSSVKETNVGFGLVPAMLSGKVDATLGAFWNYEGVDLERRKKDPVILRMEDLGVPTYSELVLVVRRRDLDQDFGGLVRRFVQATGKGHEALREDPAAGIDALLEADPGLDRGLQEAVVDATLPVFFPEDDDAALGLPGRRRVAGLHRLDGGRGPAHAAADRGAGADERVPAGRGARPAERARAGLSGAGRGRRPTRTYSPASPFHSP